MDILIIWGLGIAFLIIISTVNKIRGVVDTGQKPYHGLKEDDWGTGEYTYPGGKGYDNEDKLF